MEPQPEPLRIGDGSSVGEVPLRLLREHRLSVSYTTSRTQQDLDCTGVRHRGPVGTWALNQSQGRVMCGELGAPCPERGA